MKVYIAAGWFTPEQEVARIEMIEACRIAGIKVYSPKDDMLHIDGETTPSVIFTENISQILQCDYMLASTEGKDMGTLFECGVAYTEDIPIIYYSKIKGKFNLMLAQSAWAVFTDISKLVQYLTKGNEQDMFPHVTYTGEQE